jgi:hypothetical protein
MLISFFSFNSFILSFFLEGGVGIFHPRDESSKGFSPFRKIIFIFLFCSFCLRLKEANLKAVQGYAIPHGRLLPYSEGILETALPLGRCFNGLPLHHNS